MCFLKTCISMQVSTAKVYSEDSRKARDTLTDCEAELKHVDSPFLLQEVHETEEQVLLFSDFLQFQLQHLMKWTEQVEKGRLNSWLKSSKTYYPTSSGAEKR